MRLLTQADVAGIGGSGAARSQRSNLALCVSRVCVLLAVAKQAKQIAQRLKLQRGEASSDEEDEGEEGSDEEADRAAAKRKAAKRGAKAGAEDGDGGDALAWGASKRAYYDDGDEVCTSTDTRKRRTLPLPLLTPSLILRHVFTHVSTPHVFAHTHACCDY